jgi:hypothetical protein
MVLALLVIATAALIAVLEVRAHARGTDCGVWSDDLERGLIRGNRCWPIE